MSDICFLITGATGATGGAAAAQLLDKGERVRAFVHRKDDRSEALSKWGAEVGREITYQSMPIEKWAEVVAGASPGRPPRNDAGSLYSEADRITGRPGSEFLVQHLREVAIDHTNGVFAGTNDFVEKIGGRPPLTVEAFVAKHRDAFA
jgi:hypothetical protein